jgi:ParB family chromosome partitioning protein
MNYSPIKIWEWALIENIQRVDLNPIEIGQSYPQLIDNHSYTHEDLAKSVGNRVR